MRRSSSWSSLAVGDVARERLLLTIETASCATSSGRGRSRARGRAGAARPSRQEAAERLVVEVGEPADPIDAGDAQPLLGAGADAGKPPDGEGREELGLPPGRHDRDAAGLPAVARNLGDDLAARDAERAREARRAANGRLHRLGHEPRLTEVGRDLAEVQVALVEPEPLDRGATSRTAAQTARRVSRVEPAARLDEDGLRAASAAPPHSSSRSGSRSGAPRSSRSRPPPGRAGRPRRRAGLPRSSGRSSSSTAAKKASRSRCATITARHARAAYGPRPARPSAGPSGVVLSHDTDKLIRQLSLVAFLMAERRAAHRPGREVERRGLLGDVGRGLRPPLLLRPHRARSRSASRSQSQRDEFTGEELYTLRSEQYFLPPLELDGRGARGAPDEPLCSSTASSPTPSRCGSPSRTSRSAGPASASADRHGRARRGRRSRLLAGDARAGSTSSRARSRRAAPSGSATGRSRRDEERERTLNPYALLSRRTAPGTSSARISSATTERDVPRLADPRRDPLRDAARARLPRPGDSTSPSTAAGRPGRSATPSARRASRWPTTPPGGSSACFGDAVEVEDGVFTTPYSDLGRLASWVLRQEGRARAARAATSSSRPSTRRSRASLERHTRARPPKPKRARQPSRRSRRVPLDRLAGPGRARAIRRPPGAARLPARGLRRETHGRDPGATSSSSASASRRAARRAPRSS